MIKLSKSRGDLFFTITHEKEPQVYTEKEVEDEVKAEDRNQEQRIYFGSERKLKGKSTHISIKRI